MHNKIIAQLEPAQRDELCSRGNIVALAAGDVLINTGDVEPLVYFPLRGVIVCMAEFSDGSRVEMATIGPEGCTGICSEVAGQSAWATHAVVIEGAALAVSASAYAKIAGAAAVGTYARTFLYQLFASGACHKKHTAEQRLSCWLLFLRQKSESDEVRVTHEFIADSIGVHRPTVTRALQSLAQKGAIQSRRGAIQICDVSQLERTSCECLHLIRRHSNGH